MHACEKFLLTYENILGCVCQDIHVDLYQHRRVRHESHGMILYATEIFDTNFHVIVELVHVP
jgi:hypothetical protein